MPQQPKVAIGAKNSVFREPGMAVYLSSFLIRTLPSVQELHLIGSAGGVRRLYCRYGISPCPKDVPSFGNRIAKVSD